MRCRKEIAIRDVSNWRCYDHQRRRVKQEFMESGNFYRTFQRKGGKLELERAAQHLYPIELHCDWKYNDCIETNEVNEMTKDRHQGDLKELQQLSQKLKFEVRLKVNKAYLQWSKT